jgi:uncharacterized protein YeaO (DUF488 family)
MPIGSPAAASGVQTLKHTRGLTHGLVEHPPSQGEWSRYGPGRTEMLRTKRVYETPVPSDGQRILVDRLWPRGLRKEDAAIHDWMKEIAPSTELRQWFGHDPKKWSEFVRRYREELRGREDLLRTVASRASRGTVTLVYGARDEAHNQAVVLAAVIRPRVARARAAARRSMRRARATRRTAERPAR